MSNLHPQWQTTDEGDTIIPVRAAGSKLPAREESLGGQTMKTTTVSRRPAAVFGILVVVGMATLFYQGVDRLTGQLAATVDIRIAESGFEPQEIAVARGQQLQWVNERSVPQYIISDTLCRPSGECLNTPTMFQGDTTSYLVPEDIPDGTYSYFSPTDPNLTGTITIGDTPAQATPSPSGLGSTTQGNESDTIDAFSLAQQSLLESIQRQLELDRQPLPAPSRPAVPETPAVASVSGIPQNPYTIGSSRQFPFDSEGRPVPEAFGDELPRIPPSTQTADLFGEELERPFRQPETGPAGVGIVLIASGALLLFLTRKSFAVGG